MIRRKRGFAYADCNQATGEHNDQETTSQAMVAGLGGLGIWLYYNLFAAPPPWLNKASLILGGLGTLILFAAGVLQGLAAWRELQKREVPSSYVPGALPVPPEGLLSPPVSAHTLSPLPDAEMLPLKSSETQSSRRLKAFLCHASGDKPAVRDLCHRLHAAGIAPWLDEESLLPGQDWQLEISKAVRSSDAVIICLSSRAITKAGYVQKEIKDALDVADEQPEGTIFLIPLRLEECDVPERLRRWHWVDLFQETGYKRLIHALRTRAEDLGLSIHTWEPEVVHKPILSLEELKRRLVEDQDLKVDGEGRLY